MHKNLKRQLERVYGKDIPQSIEFLKFLEIISEAYESRDSEYELIERSLEISSKELTGVNEKLREEKFAVELIVKERTKELAQERSKFEKVAQNMDTGAILFNQVGEVVFVNNTARKLIGFHDTSFENLLQKLYATFSNYPIADLVDHCLKGNENELEDINTEHASYKIKFQVLANKNGYLIWIKDITSEKLLEQSKNELLAIASHQLRSPLTVVKGNIEMLLDESFGQLNDEQTKMMQQVNQANENMIRLIEQMLDITKINQQEVKFNIDDVCVEKILQQVIDDLQLYADKYNVQFLNYIDKNSTYTMKADQTRLYQIFQNLIENAIKYSDPKKGQGVVTVSSEVQHDKIIIKIKDTGIGIPKSEQSILFKRFQRASNAVKLSPDGTGLGLYIVKSMVEIFNGTIEFTSVENEGTTFIVNLPINV